MTMKIKNDKYLQYMQFFNVTQADVKYTNYVNFSRSIFYIEILSGEILAGLYFEK